jgi:hypothetical protein
LGPNTLRTFRNSISATVAARSLACALGLSACGGDRVDTAEAVALARAHEEDIESFAPWARRVAASETTFSSREALEEAALAPVRRRDDVEGAWIERRGPDPAIYAHPPRALIPGDLGWRRVRVEGMGEVDVARAGERVYVRRTSAAPGGAVLVVTMAFSPAPPSER